VCLRLHWTAFQEAVLNQITGAAILCLVRPTPSNDSLRKPRLHATLKRGGAHTQSGRLDQGVAVKRARQSRSRARFHSGETAL
jgi:hypothetical protein